MFLEQKSETQQKLNRVKEFGTKINSERDDYAITMGIAIKKLMPA